MIRTGSPTIRATLAGLAKMPTPMIAPATTAEASISPSSRRNSATPLSAHAEDGGRDDLDSRVDLGGRRRPAGGESNRPHGVLHGDFHRLHHSRETHACFNACRT